MAVFALLAVLLFGSLPVAAQQSSQRIVAIVNDESITAYDVEQRIRLTLGPAAQMPNAEQLRRLSTQVLRGMIDERLQMQEAKRLGIAVQPEELEDAVSRVERQNNLALGKLSETFEVSGLSMSSFEDQAKASIIWPKVVRRRAGRLVNVAEEEVDDALAQLKENADKPSHLVSQIFLSIDSPQDETKIRDNIEGLYEQIKAGTPFNVLAQQFSEDATAGSGGDAGWVQVGQISPEINEALTKMPVGAVSRPIRTAEGYYIVALRNRREPLITSAQDIKVSLNQIFLPIAASARPDEIASKRELAETISKTVSSCADMDSVAKEMASSDSGSMGTFRLGELATDMRKIVSALDVGKPSQPLKVEGGLRVVMVCGHEEPVINLPNRQEVTRLLSEQKMELQSRRFLRDLRQSAFVDIRA